MTAQIANLNDIANYHADSEIAAIDKGDSIARDFHAEAVRVIDEVIKLEEMREEQREHGKSARIAKKIMIDAGLKD